MAMFICNQCGKRIAAERCQSCGNVREYSTVTPGISDHGPSAEQVCKCMSKQTPMERPDCCDAYMVFSNRIMDMDS